MQTHTGKEVIIALALMPKFSYVHVFLCHHFFESNGKVKGIGTTPMHTLSSLLL